VASAYIALLERGRGKSVVYTADKANLKALASALARLMPK